VLCACSFGKCWRYCVLTGILLTSRLRQRLNESVYTAVCGSYSREQLWYADWVTGTADSQCHAKRAMKDMLIAWCSPAVQLCHFSPAMIYNSAINYELMYISVRNFFSRRRTMQVSACPYFTSPEHLDGFRVNLAWECSWGRIECSSEAPLMGRTCHTPEWWWSVQGSSSQWDRRKALQRETQTALGRWSGGRCSEARM